MQLVRRTRKPIHRHVRRLIKVVIRRAALAD
jgi:hypothetical protein